MKEEQLDKTLREVLWDHKKWVESDGESGDRLILNGADLRLMVLYNANIEGISISVEQLGRIYYYDKKSDKIGDHVFSIIKKEVSDTDNFDTLYNFVISEHIEEDVWDAISIKIKELICKKNENKK